MSPGLRHRLYTTMQATCPARLPSIFTEGTVCRGKQAKADNYAELVRSCGSLSDGRRLHDCIVEDELYSVSYLRKQIVQMYLKFGRPENAAAVFYGVPFTDIVTWTRLAGAYNRKGLYRQAIQVFQFMQLQGIKPDAVSFLPLLDACAGLAPGDEAKMVRSLILEAGMEENLVIKNSLINMYGKCGMQTEAWEVFKDIQQGDVVSWTSMLSACAQCGDSAGALELFHSMQQKGIRPNRIAFVAAINACNSPAAREEARKIHSSIRDSGCELEQTVGNAVINMYAKCGDTAAALEIFLRMPEHDVISWTSLASAYAQQQMLKEVLLVVQRMQLAGVKPNKVTFVTLLNACETPSDQAVAKMIHASVVDAGFESDAMVGNAVVNMYGKCGNLEDAKQVFERLPRRDVISWNALISAYARRSHDREPLLLFERMEAEQVVPNKVTFVTVLYACGRLKALEEGRSIHGRLVEAGLADDVVAGTAVVNMYAKCGLLEDARRLFEMVQKQDAAAWNVMISAYVEQGIMVEALELFQRMEAEGTVADEVTYISILGGCTTSSETLEAGRQLHGLISKRKLEVSNLVIGTALLDMYVKLGSLEEAENVFTRMQRHDLVSWTTMVVAYAQSGHVGKALFLFRRMQQEGVVPDRVALEIVLSACSTQEFLAAGKLIHYSIRGNSPETETGVLNTVVNLYGKCSCLAEARLVFDSIRRKDRETWAAMVGAYSRQGCHAQVMELFQQLLDEGEQGPVEASRVVLVSVVTACGHLGETAQGVRAHCLVKQAGLQFDIVVGTALVTMYGKLGNLEEALASFELASRARLSELVEPKEDLILWTAMVAAYAHNGRGDESVELFFRLQQEGLEPDPVVFTAVLTACSGAGLGEQGICFFASMATDYGIQANKQHITCMADLLGRSGRLAEAEALLELVSSEDDDDDDDETLWTSLVGSCRMHADLERGERLAELWMRSQPKSSSAYVVLSGIHKSRSVFKGGGIDVANFRNSGEQ